MSKTWKHAGLEPTIAQILDDPIFGLLMKRDGVERQELVRLINDYQQANEQRTETSCAHTRPLKTGTYSSN